MVSKCQHGCPQTQCTCSATELQGYSYSANTKKQIVTSVSSVENFHISVAVFHTDLTGPPELLRMLAQITLTQLRTDSNTQVIETLTVSSQKHTCTKGKFDCQKK